MCVCLSYKKTTQNNPETKENSYREEVDRKMERMGIDFIYLVETFEAFKGFIYSKTTG